MGTVFVVTILFLIFLGWVAFLVKPSTPEQTRGPSQPREERSRPRAGRITTLSSDETGFIAGNGEYRLHVVGESHYQKNLERVCGGRTDESANHECEATIILDDENEYDPEAVRVEVDGLKVGHLSRANARRWRKALAAVEVDPTELRCAAVVRGGWDRGKRGRANFGIFLAVPVQY